MVVQREILFGLLGHAGRAVIDDDGHLALAPGLPLMDKSEQVMIQRLLRLGDCYRSINQFVTAKQVARKEGDSRACGNSYMTAFALGLDKCLQPYRARVLDLEQQLLRAPDLSLTALQVGFGDFDLVLPALARLLETIQSRHLHGSALHDFLHHEATCCAQPLRRVLHVLLHHTQSVLRSQLAAWLLHGEILPSDEEFFIARSPPRPRDLELSTIANHQGHGSEDSVGWNTFQVIVSRKPSAFPMRVADRILFIGKAVRVLRASQYGSTHDQKMQARLPKVSHSKCGSLASTSASSAGILQTNSHSQNQRPSWSEIDRDRTALEIAQEMLGAAEIELERAAVAELHAEAECHGAFSRLIRQSRKSSRHAPECDGEHQSDRGRLSSNDTMVIPTSASDAMRSQLEAMSDELRSLPTCDGSLQLGPLERFISKLHHRATTSLWHHLTVEW